MSGFLLGLALSCPAILAAAWLFSALYRRKQAKAFHEITNKQMPAS